MKNSSGAATIWIVIGAVVAATAVLCSSFGAHGLERLVAEMEEPAKRIANWSTAARFQMYHGLGLLLCGVLRLNDLTFFNPTNAQPAMVVLELHSNKWQ